MYRAVSSRSENQALRGHLADGSFHRVPPCSGKFGGKSGGKHAHPRLGDLRQIDGFDRL